MSRSRRILSRPAWAIFLGGLVLVAVSASHVAVSDDRGFPWFLAGLVVVGAGVVWTWRREKRRLASLLMLFAAVVALLVGFGTGPMRSEWILRRELPTYEVAARQCLASQREGPCKAPALGAIDYRYAAVERGRFWLLPQHHHVYVVYAPGSAGRELSREEWCVKHFQRNWYLVRRC